MNKWPYRSQDNSSHLTSVQGIIMNCSDFKRWMLDVKFEDPSAEQFAQAHIDVCASCKKLYRMDLAMERCLGDAMTQINPPADLVSKIKQDLHSIPAKPKKTTMRWQLMAPALAAAVVLLFFIHSLMVPMQGIQNLGSLALANHLDDRQRMSFSAGEINDIAGWFAKRIGFAAAPPKLFDDALVLQGGRPCKLGLNHAAYLIYQKNGKKCSVFVINPADLDFKLEKDKRFSVKENDHDIKIWSESNLVYAMVI